jgi:Exopolysaccharide synthesis, ExoD
MQDIPAETKKRAPSSRVLQEVIRQAPAEYVTVGWLTSTLHRHSFGIIMLSLGLLATTPVGSTVPGFILAVMAVQLIVGRSEPVFPHFIMTRRLPTKQLRRIGGRVRQDPHWRTESHRDRFLSMERRACPCSSAAWMIWHGYDLSALLFLAPLLSSRRQQNGSSRRNGRVGAAATKFKRRNVRSDDALDRPLQSYSWPV